MLLTISVIPLAYLYIVLGEILGYISGQRSRLHLGLGCSATKKGAEGAFFV
ncbi:Uncharacterised protein [Yersinia massiliensis]|nr:Uncharacterised protein [Yersinia massiliensis]